MFEFYSAQPERAIKPMLVYCCSTVYDADPTINQHWFKVLCFSVVDPIYALLIKYSYIHILMFSRTNSLLKNVNSMYIHLTCIPNLYLLCGEVNCFNFIIVNIIWSKFLSLIKLSDYFFSKILNHAENPAFQYYIKIRAVLLKRLTENKHVVGQDGYLNQSCVVLSRSTALGLPGPFTWIKKYLLFNFLLL